MTGNHSNNNKTKQKKPTNAINTNKTTGVKLSKSCRSMASQRCVVGRGRRGSAAGRSSRRCILTRVGTHLEITAQQLLRRGAVELRQGDWGERLCG